MVLHCFLACLVGATLVVTAFGTQEGDNAEKWAVSWNAPFLASSSGYGSEATSFVLGLNHSLPDEWDISVGLAHGDVIDWDLIGTLDPELLEFLDKAAQKQLRLDPRRTIVVCHAEPGAWSVPSPLYESGSPCPPSSLPNISWHAVIGRTMFETDRLPVGWNTRLNAVTEVWVPTKHHQRIFVEGGVTKPVIVIGQGIDTNTWDPHRVDPLHWKDIDYRGNCHEGAYKFLSVFKWEDRKGHDVLVKSFWRAFSPPTNHVCLIIVTSLYHEDVDGVMQDFEEYYSNATGKQGLEQETQRGILLLSRLPTEDLVRLYKTVDAFVLPSRGEGWGRPYMEAMSMGLPVIATNWSGPTEFVTEANGYLLPIAGLADAQLDAFPGHQWADPDEHALQRLMLHIVNNPQEGRQKGAKARDDVLKHWSHSAMAKVVARELQRLAKSIDTERSRASDKDEL